MNVQRRNDVAIYCLSSGPTIPEWLGERGRRNLAKRDESVRRRIELIQDFQMPASSSKIVQSADGRYLVASGTYPPRIRCYDLNELTMKFERYINASVIDMVLLSEDYGKIAMLRDDRTIDFHAPYGAHESIRIPKFGRAMAYEPTTCELLVAAKGNEIYRVNLQEGRFSEPWTFDAAASASAYDASSSSATCIAVHQTFPLAAVGCDDGIVRFWDSRSMSWDNLKPFLKLDVQSATAGYGYYFEENSNNDAGIFAAAAATSTNHNPHEISCVAHDSSGLYMAAGTAGGLVALYDVRSSRPLYIQEHKHGLPIHTVRFHSTSGLVLSGDEKLIKAWRFKTGTDVGRSVLDSSSGDVATNNDDSMIGSVKVNIEGTGKIANFVVAGDETDPTGNQSGLILCATDQPKMESYYVPAIGMAPKWCSFLENITEELEERDLTRGRGEGKRSAASDLVRDGQESIYENYKFVSRDDVEKLGISNLVGTPLLRGYMHGFFMDVNLYNRVKAVADPFEYEEYQKKKLKERIEAKRASRIAPRASDRKSNKPAVNPDLAERLQHRAGDSSKAGKIASRVLSDSRFGSLFTNPDFHIDEEDEDFKLRNPSGVAAAKRRKNNLDSDEEDDNVTSDEEEEETRNHVDRFNDSEEDVNDDESELDSESDSDDDGFLGGKVRGEAYGAMKAPSRKSARQTPEKKKKKKTVMYEADELDGKSTLDLGLGDKDALKRASIRLEEMNMPLAGRLAKQREKESMVEVRVEGGAKEATFIPRDTQRKMEEEAKRREESRQKGKRKRRGVKELGFKTPFRNT